MDQSSKKYKRKYEETKKLVKSLVFVSFQCNY